MNKGVPTPVTVAPSPGAMLPRHLHRLEAESITILREVAAEFRNPVLLYSIGKDSSVLLHLARKAFYPGRLPLPLLHVDTTWKFREMIAFRDHTVRRLNLDLIVYVNHEGLSRGIDPFTSGSSLHTDIMKTEALKQALDKYGFDAALGGAAWPGRDVAVEERLGNCITRDPGQPAALTRHKTRGVRRVVSV